MPRAGAGSSQRDETFQPELMYAQRKRVSNRGSTLKICFVSGEFNLVGHSIRSQTAHLFRIAENQRFQSVGCGKTMLPDARNFRQVCFGQFVRRIKSVIADRRHVGERYRGQTAAVLESISANCCHAIIAIVPADAPFYNAHRDVANKAVLRIAVRISGDSVGRRIPAGKFVILRLFHIRFDWCVAGVTGVVAIGNLGYCLRQSRAVVEANRVICSKSAYFRHRIRQMLCNDAFSLRN